MKKITNGNYYYFRKTDEDNNRTFQS